MTASRLAAVLAAVVALSAASAAVPQPFPRATPESQGVPSEAVLDLVERHQLRSPAIVDVILDCGGDAVSVRTECQLFKRYRHPAEK